MTLLHSLLNRPAPTQRTRVATASWVLAALAMLAGGSSHAQTTGGAAPAPAPAPAAAPAPVNEEATAAAEKLGDEGREAYRGGRYADAIALFEKAFALGSKPSYLYNIARAKEKMAAYDSAVTYLEKYLESHRKQNAGADPQNAADVKNLIRDFKQRAFEAQPEVTVNSTPPGAQVYLAATDGLLAEGGSEKGALIGSTPVTTHLKTGTYSMTLELINHSTHKAELQVPVSGKVSLSISMKLKQSRSGLSLWCNVKGAQVALDGKIVAVTPFAGVLPSEPGSHQLTLTRVGYDTADIAVTLAEDQLTTVRANLVSSHGPPASWRSYLGWPLMILGGGAIGAGYVAGTYADKVYAGTTMFLEREKLQNYGYWGGGAGVAVGLGLVIWDWTRSGINSDDLVTGPFFDNGQDVKPLPPPEKNP